MIEQRRYERVGFLAKIELSAATDGAVQAARSVDLSLGGVGAVTKSVFSPGQMVTVTFFLKDTKGGEVKDQVPGHIVRFHADVDTNVVGIQFLSPLSEAEHPALVGKLMRL
jgi:c-di-GMP-binding flagellar brake protein YcgR